MNRPPRFQKQGSTPLPQNERSPAETKPPEAPINLARQRVQIGIPEHEAASSAQRFSRQRVRVGVPERGESSAASELSIQRVQSEAPEECAENSSAQGQDLQSKEELKLFAALLRTKGVTDAWAGGLYPFQCEGCAWMGNQEQTKGGGLMCDDMGLGKTLQMTAMVALRGAREAGCEGGTLILCQKNLMPIWASAFGLVEEDLENPEYVERGKFKVVKWHGDKRSFDPDVLATYDVIITTVETFIKGASDGRNPLAGNMRLTRMIIDESTKIKEAQSVSFRSLRSVNAKYRWCVSATPMENSIDDLYSHLSMIRYGEKSEMEEKGGRAADVKKSGKLTDRQLAWWKEALSDVALMRSKEGSSTQLPRKVERIERIEMGPEESAAYGSLTAGRGRGTALSSGGRLEAMTRQRQHANGTRRSARVSADDEPSPDSQAVSSAKLARIISIVSAEVARSSSAKIVVFAQMVEALKLIRDSLESVGIRSKMYIGEMSEPARNDATEEWQKPIRHGGTHVLLISLIAGGAGLTLLGGPKRGPRMVVLYEQWWNEAKEMQAINRMHRLGQKNEVTVVRFIVAGTVEEHMKRVKDKKSNVIDTILALIRDRPLNPHLISNLLGLPPSSTQPHTSTHTARPISPRLPQDMPLPTSPSSPTSSSQSADADVARRPAASSDAEVARQPAASSDAEVARPRAASSDADVARPRAASSDADVARRRAASSDARSSATGSGSGGQSEGRGGDAASSAGSCNAAGVSSSAGSGRSVYGSCGSDQAEDEVTSSGEPQTSSDRVPLAPRQSWLNAIISPVKFW